MPVGCTRCGERQEGEILTPPIVFKFPHAKGCGMGIGPLCVIKGQVKKSKKEDPPKVEDIKVEIKTETSEYKQIEGKSTEKIILDESKKKSKKSDY